jgi:2-oxopent-4-enoate/cis-2-oxohex-4-enoate hydratase
MLSPDKVNHLAAELYGCLRSGAVTAPLTEREPDISISDAYQISQQILASRLEDGERVVGKKIGVTSDAVQSMLGVYEPDFGFLTDAMQFGAGDIPVGQLIQPRAEAEIAFVLGHDLPRSGVTAADVLAATAEVRACFEIVDSRIEDWCIKIQDTVADNASCGYFVLAEQGVDPRGMDLPSTKVTVAKNGQFLSQGLGSAVQGSPLQAIAWLANTLGALGVSLLGGEIILSGSLVPLEPVKAGDRMSMVIPEIGELAIRFTE